MKRKVNVEKGKKGFQKTVPQVKEPPKKLATPTAVLPELNPHNIMQNWEQYLENVEISGVNPNEHVEKEEKYSFEELETLWELLQGKNSGTKGNPQTEWVNSDTSAFLDFVKQVQIGGGATPKAWHEFFNTLNPQVKEEYITQYTCDLAKEYDNDGGKFDNGFKVALTTPDQGANNKQPPSGKEKPDIPVELCLALLKDVNPVMKVHLAATESLPEPIARILLKERRLEVLYYLAANSSSASNFLEDVEARLTQLESGEGGKPIYKMAGLEELLSFEDVRENISRRENAPPSAMNKYITMNTSNLDLVSRSLANKNVDAKVATQHYLRIKKETHDMEEKLADRKGSTPNSTSEKELKNQIAFNKKIITTFLTFGKAPHDEVVKSLNKNISSALRNSSPPQENRQNKHVWLAGTTLLHSELSPSEMESYYKEVKKLPGKPENFGYMWAGIMANPVTPQHVKEDFISAYEKIDPEEFRTDFYFRKSKQTFNRTLEYVRQSLNLN